MLSYLSYKSILLPSFLVGPSKLIAVKRKEIKIDIDKEILLFTFRQAIDPITLD